MATLPKSTILPDDLRRREAVKPFRLRRRRLEHLADGYGQSGRVADRHQTAPSPVLEDLRAARSGSRC